MAEAFECPNCGAPLDYPGTGETMRCPFCGNSVIVPPELRPAPPPPQFVPPPPPAPPPIYVLPPPVYVQQPVVRPRPARRRSGNCLGVVILIIVAVAVLPTFASTRAFLRAFGRSGVLQSLVPTVVNSFVTQGLPNGVAATALAAVAQANATARAAMTEMPVAAGPTPDAQATGQAVVSAVNGPRSWPAAISDTFDRNASGWTTGDENNSYYSGTRQIASGRYHWALKAKTGMSTFEFADMRSVSDLFAGVDVLTAVMPPDGQAGLAFRHSAPAHTWYNFALKGNNTYALTMFDGQNWTELIPWTPSSAIHAGRTNRLEVSARGPQIVLLINKQVVNSIEDSTLTDGDVGLGLDLTNAKDQAEVDFDNFEVRTPAQ